MEALDFSVHVDLFANPTASLADLLLPAASCWECEAVLPSPPPYALAEHTATWAQLRQAVVRPVHEARPDLEIIFALAQRLGLGAHFFGGDIEMAFNHQLAPSGLTVQQLREHPAGRTGPGRDAVPEIRRHRCPDRLAPGLPDPDAQAGDLRHELCPSRVPTAARGLEPAATSRRLETDEKYPLALTFSRLVQFCNDHHRNIPRLRRQAREPFLEIHPTTASALQIEDEEWVVLETAEGRVPMKAKLNAALDPRWSPRSNGWWQACQELGLPATTPSGQRGRT